MSVDPLFRKLSLCLLDKAGRQHTLDVHLPDEYPNSPPTCSADLPVLFQPVWDADSQNRLVSLVQQFRAVLDQFQDFWRVTDDWETHTWVLEPAKPSRSQCMRRIAVGKAVSVSVDLDPLHPYALSQCKFFGPETAVEQLEQKLQQNLHLWRSPDSTLTTGVGLGLQQADEGQQEAFSRPVTPRENLETVLEIQFPQPSKINKEEYNIECGVCYTFQLGQEVPDSVCDNTKCARCFHRSCLYDWLRALPTSRQSFGTIFGNCPYCSNPLTVDDSGFRN
mmetsp:Transcript_47957/g.94170  ORF Transcript_47957/g.94170 Transcript_47957/m.94170 type:complete len:278 (+) Transcript_47957:32-865(+)